MILYDQHGHEIRSEDSGSVSGFDGASTSSARTAFLEFPTNPRREMSRYTRRELVRKRRALDANLGIFGRITGKIGQHSVGKGIFPRPITKDKAWNAANRKRFENRMSNPLLYSVAETYDFWEDQRWVAETLPGDGEVFEANVWKGEDRRTQRFDVFEIETAWDRLQDERWQDGVLTDAWDAPRAYGVMEHPRVGEPWRSYDRRHRRVPAAAMMHIFKSKRAHQCRGITWFHAGINDAIDCLELKALEKGTAKLHSLLGLVVRKKQAEAGNKGISNQLKKVLDGDGNLTQVEENFWRGAAIQYMATDEGIELLSSDRPSPNLLAFIQMLYRDIATALGLPLSIVYNMAESGGASARADLEDGQWFFDMVQDTVVMRHSRRIYIWDTANAMKNGELPMCKDPEWWACAWRGPAKLTVDLGRSADAAVKLMRNAALSHVRYHEERAQDVFEEMEEEIQFRAWLSERCKLAGVDYRELIEPTPGSVTTVNVEANESSK